MLAPRPSGVRLNALLLVIGVASGHAGDLGRHLKVGVGQRLALFGGQHRHDLASRCEEALGNPAEDVSALELICLPAARRLSGGLEGGVELLVGALRSLGEHFTTGRVVDAERPFRSDRLAPIVITNSDIYDPVLPYDADTRLS
jgi:hypothetical protein